mgnify:CR=1 FL=1
MFLENKSHRQEKRGWIEVVCGSMFSGKTEELIRRLKRAQIARLNVEIFKPALDNRYSETEIVSHDAKTIHSQPVKNSGEILENIKNVDVVGIDEAQFFDNGIVEVCEKLANNGVRVIIAGLDMDFQANPFGPMPALMCKAEHVTKVHAICMRCGNPAQYSHRFSESKSVVEIGEKDKYEPLCRSCYNEATNKN